MSPTSLPLPSLPPLPPSLGYPLSLLPCTLPGLQLAPRGVLEVDAPKGGERALLRGDVWGRRIKCQARLMVGVHSWSHSWSVWKSFGKGAASTNRCPLLSSNPASAAPGLLSTSRKSYKRSHWRLVAHVQAVRAAQLCTLVVG